MKQKLKELAKVWGNKEKDKREDRKIKCRRKGKVENACLCYLVEKITCELKNETKCSIMINWDRQLQLEES